MQKVTFTLNEEEEWIKILGKGMVTIPKPWRDELNLKEGKIILAKKMGNKIIMEPQERNVPYRIYSQDEINQFLKEDVLPKTLKKRLEKRFGKDA